MPITYTQANKLLDYNFGSTAYTLPENYYIALSTTAIQADGTGCTEPSGNSYARVQVPNNKTQFSVSQNGILKNLEQIQFPESTGNWGTIINIAIFDAPTDGNLLYYDSLTESRTVESQTTLLFVPNSITIQLS